MQVHHVIYFDTADEQWHIDRSYDCYMPDGPVWDDSNGEEEADWRALNDYEETAYSNTERDLIKYLNANPHLEV